MQILKPATAGSLSIQIAAPVAPGTDLTAVSFDIVDENGTLVQAPASGTIVDADAATVTLPVGIGAVTLPVGETRGIRKARVAASYGATIYNTEVLFIVRDSEALVFGENSFLTYMEAELIGFETAELNGWTNATAEQRVTALMSAREDLCSLSFTYDPYDAAQNRITDWPGGFGMHRPELWTAADLVTLPREFLRALKRAQVIQADHRLGGNPEERAREHGLMSKTVGESSEMFRPGIRPLEFPVCKRAMQALKGFTTVKKWHIGRG